MTFCPYCRARAHALRPCERVNRGRRFFLLGALAAPVLARLPVVKPRPLRFAYSGIDWAIDGKAVHVSTYWNDFSGPVLLDEFTLADVQTAVEQLRKNSAKPGDFMPGFEGKVVLR